MTTKRSKKSIPQKETIPAGWLTIRDAEKNLEQAGVKISYHGLSYYRRLGIIGEPRRFKGCMDKYYYYPNLLKFVQTAKSLTSSYDIELTRVKIYVSKLPKDVYFELPRLLLNAHDKIWPTSQEYVVPTYSTLYIGMPIALDNTIKKLDPNKIDEFVSMLEKETKKVKKDLIPDKR